jgi:hypothetical protein
VEAVSIDRATGRSCGIARRPQASEEQAAPQVQPGKCHAGDGRPLRRRVLRGTGLFVYDVAGKLVWKKDLGNISAGWFYDPDYEWGIAARR